MDYLTIEGVKPYDGRYEFDPWTRSLTTREWGWVKRYAGYLPLTVDEGLAGTDPELWAVFAVIALRRAGKIETREVGAVYERIADAPFGSAIGLESDPAEEVDADPPALRTTGNESSSGDASRTSSETSARLPSTSGASVSDASESARLRSAI